MSLIQTNHTENAANIEDSFFEELRTREYARIDQQKQVYFDFTGGNLYPESLLNEHFSFLKNNVLGNPHSTNPTSKLATLHVEATRKKVLEFFNAQDDYFCIFTANASSALKIIGECYPFNEKSKFTLFFDNHNSVNGLREFCKTKGAQFQYIPMNYLDLRIDETVLQEELCKADKQENNLFAFPAQSNVSGVKHDLNWIKNAQELGWDVVLDAAAFVPTSQLDLQKHPANFVSVSFYKIFGFPTGIGCLLVRKDSFTKLHKPWFAGGTVSIVSVNEPMHKLQSNHERFEDGTVNYLQLPAIKNGLEFIESIGMDRINKRISTLTNTILNTFTSLKHRNGKALIQVYGPQNTEMRGGTIIFNVLDDAGNALPFPDVEASANERNISIRTGCFCNPGIDEITHCISTEELANYYTSTDGANFMEMIQFLCKMRGAVRISVGFITNKQDLDTLFNFIESFK